VDLRLVVPALAAWATAAWALDAPSGRLTVLVAGCLAAAAGLWAVRRVSARAGDRRRLWGAWSRVSVTAVLLCVAAAAVSAGLSGADLRRGPVPALARQYAEVTAEMEVVSDPRLTRPRVRGDHAAPTAVLLDGEVQRLTKPDGTVAAMRVPVLVVVDASAHAAASGARSGAERRTTRAPWLALLPSTRVRVTARLAPPLTGGDRVAAVLRVRSGAPPDVVGGPSRAQR
jgi:competence protein ComEC